MQASVSHPLSYNDCVKPGVFGPEEGAAASEPEGLRGGA
jgi:hypothetical protein